MKRVSILLVCLVLGLGTAWASAGSTNPNIFIDPVNWCQFGCGGAEYSSPQAWAAAGGETGLVGNSSGLDSWNLQQGTSWNGNFPNLMGLMYNGAYFTGTPTTVSVVLDQPVNGIGAWIQATWFGNFTASITLLDNNLVPFYTYTASGNSQPSPNTGLFIGAYDGTANIWGAIFDTTANGYHDHDFAIGTMELNATPEPSTLLLLAPSVLGLGGVLRRRLARKS